MPGLIVETEKKLQEDDWIVEDDDDMDGSDESDDAGDSDDDDDKEDDAQEPTKEQLAEIRMELAKIRREIADIRMMMEDNFKQILLTLKALPDKVSEILAQHVSVSHEPGPNPASTTVDSVASKPDSAYSSPAHAPDVDAPPATTSCAPDSAPVFLVPAAVVPVPPIEVGDTHMPDAAA